MINKNFKDERIIAEQHKIASDAFQMVSVFLLISVLYKQFILDEPFTSYMTEFIAFFGGSFYILIRNVIKGNGIFDSKKHGNRIYLLNSLISSSAVTIIASVSNYMKYIQNRQNIVMFFIEIVIIFLSSFAITFFCMWGVGWISKKRENKIRKEYEDDM
ncbi:DUF6773 family protein [Clostridium sp. LBM24168]